LGPTQSDAIAADARLLELPCAPAGDVYTGVLFGELDLPSLDPETRARADETLVVASALFGLVRAGDPIPAYRLSGTVSLPRLGAVAGRWRPVLPKVLDEAVGDGLLVDLRSGTYVQLGKPSPSLAPRTASVRVLHESGGVRKIVSHFNKATKGRLVRALITEGVEARSVDGLADAWRDLGWTVEQDGTRLDVVVTDV
ncbi:MAG: peroxide stress protein YaaA, partial [Actinomycetales bacterium]